METQKNYALPIAMMFILFFLTGFVTGIGGPLTSTLESQFGILKSTASLGNTATFLAYVVMGIPAGMMLQKVGYKKTALTGIITGIVGIFIQYLSGQMASFEIYLFGAFISGLAMCMFNTVVNPMLNTLGGGGSKGNQLIQGAGAAYSVGSILAPILILKLGSMGSHVIADINPIFFATIGVFAIAFVTLYMMDLPEPGMEKGVEVRLERSPLAFRHYLLGTICIFLYMGTDVAVPNVITLFLTSSPEQGGMGLDLSIAGGVAGIYWLLMMVGRFVAAGLASKFSSRAMVATLAFVGLILVIIGIFTLNPEAYRVAMPTIAEKMPLGVVIITCSGLCNSVMFGGIFNLAMEGLGKYTKVASGIYMVMICGGGILFPLQTRIAEYSSFGMSYWVIAFIFSFILFYALVGSKNVNKDIPV